MKIKTRLSGFLCLILSLMLLLTMVACGGGDSGLYIDVPSEPVECELGTYEIEIPKVRDESGAVISGKTVTIKKAAYEDGQAITVPSSNMITVEEPAIVNVTFRADGVKDAVMVLDFADRTAPEIQLI